MNNSQAIREALEHSAKSIHHPACKAARSQYSGNPELYCTCHVQKARNVLASWSDMPDFRALLAAILPYAESRAEDLDEAKEAGNEDPTFPGAADACAAVDAAKAALGGEVMPWTIIAPYNAPRELLNCAELNQDDLEPETRELIRRLQTIADPLAIPSAADLRKSRVADAGEDMLAALRAAWCTRSEAEWRTVAPDTHKLIVQAVARAEGEEIA